MSRPRISGRTLRQVSQVLCLLGFLWLFLQTEYRGIDRLPYPVSLLFRIDPLAALADILAPGPFSLALLWPALVVALLTVFFGRFFCGWVCPLVHAGVACRPPQPAFETPRAPFLSPLPAGGSSKGACLLLHRRCSR